MEFCYDGLNIEKSGLKYIYKFELKKFLIIIIILMYLLIDCFYFVIMCLKIVIGKDILLCKY